MARLDEADRLAVDAADRGRVEEEARRRRTAQTIGRQTSILAGQGTDLAGSPTDIRGDTAAAGEGDALTIRSNAAREAWSHRAKGAEFDNEAALANFRQAASGLSLLGAGASLVGDAGTVAEKWYRFGSGRAAV